MSGLYTDIGALLDGGEVDSPKPTVGLRDDGVGLFYAGHVNSLFGDPESGKSWVALAALADELSRGGRGLALDLDHNGARATVARLIAMGVDDIVLRDPQRFRYAEGEDADHVTAIVKDSAAWRPTVAIVDSLGELLPLFAASSNSADDFTRVHAVALKPLAAVGAAVIAIDHVSKGTDSARFGATGTSAKKRAISGTSLRCMIAEPFRPGHGGRSQLTISKDRHGGLRASCPSTDREPLAATFVLGTDLTGDLTWRFAPPAGVGAQRSPDAPVDSLSADIAALSRLDPPPASQRDVKNRLSWGSSKALAALRAWREAGAPTVLPRSSSVEERSTGAALGGAPRERQERSGSSRSRRAIA